MPRRSRFWWMRRTIEWSLSTSASDFDFWPVSPEHCFFLWRPPKGSSVQKGGMNMAKNFKELRGGMSAAAKAASAVERSRLVEEMSLLQLRKARELTQTKIASELHMGQRDISKLERRTDMYVSTLASYLQAVGADLEIRAVFPDGRAVTITQFSEELT